MKILMVIYMFPPVTGGGEQGAFGLARTLAKMGHDIHVATTQFKGLKRFEEMDGVKVHRIIRNPFLGPYKSPQGKSKLLSSMAMVHFMLASQFPLARLVRKEGFDVINAHFAMPAGAPAMKVSKLTSTPLVTTLVGGDLYTPEEPLFMSLFRTILSPGYRYIFSHSALTAISTDTIKRARALGCNEKVVLTPYGIDTKKFSRKPPDKKLVKKLGTGGKTVLISVSRLSRRKGLDYLLRAVAALGDGVKLIMVGDGVERESLTKLSDELGIRDRVVFVGKVPNEKLLDYYNLADIFVLPSLHEGMGIVFLEAMACGLPVVTTNIGGMVDFVKDGKTGLLVDPKNAEQLSDALSKLITDKKLRGRIAKSGERLVRTEYTWGEAAKRYLEVFNKAVK